MKFVTSCCNRPIEDCPGCPGGMYLMNVEESKSEQELNKRTGIDWEKVDCIDWEKVGFDKEQFIKGVKAEMKEHSGDFPDSDPEQLGSKIAWAHLKEDPKYYDKLEKMEESYIQVIHNIENKIITTQDFTNLINNSRVVHESVPSSIKDRIRRRVTPSNKLNRKKHDRDGHRSGSLKPAARTQPKRKPSGNAQMNGRGKVGHKHSTKTQRRNAALEDRRSDIGKQMGEQISEYIESSIYKASLRLQDKNQK